MSIFGFPAIAGPAVRTLADVAARARATGANSGGTVPQVKTYADFSGKAGNDAYFEALFGPEE